MAPEGREARTIAEINLQFIERMHSFIAASSGNPVLPRLEGDPAGDIVGGS
ncbi:hypothetical protein GCM10023063_33200 [Arthrobacter methylotrophus]